MEVGIDIEELQRIKSAYERFGRKFLDRFLSDKEIEYCLSKKRVIECLGGRFCAKEAVIKIYDGRIGFKDIEIISDGKPVVFVKSKKSNIKLSISHTKNYATAVAILP